MFLSFVALLLSPLRVGTFMWNPVYFRTTAVSPIRGFWLHIADTAPSSFVRPHYVDLHDRYSCHNYAATAHRLTCCDSCGDLRPSALGNSSTPIPRQRFSREGIVWCCSLARSSWCDTRLHQVRSLAFPMRPSYANLKRLRRRTSIRRELRHALGK